MNITSTDRIVTAWAEHCDGPGWRNDIVWILVQPRNGELRIESVQADEQDTRIRHLFRLNALASAEMLAAVRARVKDLSK